MSENQFGGCGFQYSFGSKLRTYIHTDIYIYIYIHICSSEQLNNRFIHVGVDTSRYALLIGGRSSYPPCIS